jgi:RNase P protein component
MTSLALMEARQSHTVPRRGAALPRQDLLRLNEPPQMLADARRGRSERRRSSGGPSRGTEEEVGPTSSLRDMAGPHHVLILAPKGPAETRRGRVGPTVARRGKARLRRARRQLREALRGFLEAQGPGRSPLALVEARQSHTVPRRGIMVPRLDLQRLGEPPRMLAQTRGGPCEPRRGAAGPTKA